MFLLVQDFLIHKKGIVHINPEKNMSGNKVFLGIVAAAVAGAVIGLLFAPEDGSKTIKKIKKRTNSLASDLIDALEKSKQKAEKASSELKNEGAAYKDEAMNKAAEYADTAKEEYNNL